MAEPLIKLGPISHIGLVVEDCEKTAAWYTRVFGLGPWSIKEYDMEKEAPYFLVNGKQHAPKFKAAIAFSGDVFIELVEVQRGETTHTEFLRKRGEGMQHLAFSVENGKEMVAELKKEGIEPLIEYEFHTDFEGQRVHVYEVYLNTAEFTGGMTVQLLEMTPVEA